MQHASYFCRRTINAFHLWFSWECASHGDKWIRMAAIFMGSRTFKYVITHKLFFFKHRKGREHNVNFIEHYYLGTYSITMPMITFRKSSWKATNHSSQILWSNQSHRASILSLINSIWKEHIIFDKCMFGMDNAGGSDSTW